MHYLGPLQSHRDAVEEDECKDDVVEELMGDNGLAQQPEPDKRGVEEGRGKREICGKIYSRNVSVSRSFSSSPRKMLLQGIPQCSLVKGNTLNTSYK